MKNNIGKLFYKEYYNQTNFYEIIFDGAEGSLGEDKNKSIKESELVLINNPMATHRFATKILYPGLLTGTGLVHNSKNITGGYNLGMHFDYTFGMPVVYGSSVKGVLKSYFKEFCLDANVPESETDDLCKLIFEGKRRIDTPKADGGKPIYQDISIYERDIFFDAVITDPYRSRILEDDSITPHTAGPLKNPIPITMLKIAPGCKLEFRFKLHNSEVNGKRYDANWKLKMFQEILTTVGVGAKTNVGYGQLELESDKHTNG